MVVVGACTISNGMNSKILKYLILLAFILLIGAISSFWLSGPSFREKDVIFELEGPTQVGAGEEVMYKLKYSNETRSTLHNLNLSFFYPEGSAVLVDGQILEDHSEDFTIDELAVGEKGEKEFSAFLIGEKGSVRVAKANISFKAGTLSSVFEKDVSLSTTIVSAPITLILVAPPNAVSGADIQYILDYRNVSDEDAFDLILELDYPDGFTPHDFEPAPDLSKNTWNIKSLKKGSGNRITMGGVLNGKEGESKIASVKLKRKISGEYVDYQKSSAVTVISNPVLGLGVTVNNSTDYAATLGDRLNYVIKYTNNTNINFFGMNLSVKLDGDTFDFSTLDTRGGFYDDSTRTITWNPSVVADFQNFTPNLKGQINFSVGLKSAFSSVIPGASQDSFVKVSAKFGTQKVPDDFDGNEVYVLSNLVTKISTQPNINQAIYYNDPGLGSSGPLPLRVGEETFFTVHWQLTNPGNEIENVKIIGKLSPGIEWEGIAMANNDLPVPTFNVNSAEVSWILPKLPYGTGTVSDKYEGVFRIKVKPSSQQVGSKVDLLSSLQFTGTDSFTKQGLFTNKGTVNSDTLVDRPREGTVR